MDKLTFTVFADLHHHDAWYKTEAAERLTVIQQRAAASHSRFLLCLGDFCHQPSGSGDLIRQYREYPIPGHFVLGNHEFDIDTHQTVLQAYGLERGYYFFDCGGFRFVILDENYFRDFPGYYFHYSARNYFDHPASRDHMPPEELAWLRETLLTSPHPCVIASHAAITYPSDNIRCSAEVEAILAEAAGTPGRVVLCLNGHYHRSGLDIVNGIPRLDVNSASFNWVPTPHKLFPEEWYAQYEAVGNQIIYQDPPSCVITLDPAGGEITIEGSQSRFVEGVSTEISGNKSGFRLCTPDMLSTVIPMPV